MTTDFDDEMRESRTQARRLAVALAVAVCVALAARVVCNWEVIACLFTEYREFAVLEVGSSREIRIFCRLRLGGTPAALI